MIFEWTNIFDSYISYNKLFVLWNLIESWGCVLIILFWLTLRLSQGSIAPNFVPPGSLVMCTEQTWQQCSSHHGRRKRWCQRGGRRWRPRELVVTVQVESVAVGTSQNSWELFSSGISRFFWIFIAWRENIDLVPGRRELRGRRHGGRRGRRGRERPGRRGRQAVGRLGRQGEEGEEAAPVRGSSNL